ncbi:hypothetical protein FB451DRAFT_1167549 [Mycena latifolia]|nr:hypothetical protein FB451DRAFT_1167549 [Mycena latifolia]
MHHGPGSRSPLLARALCIPSTRSQLVSWGREGGGGVSQLAHPSLDIQGYKLPSTPGALHGPAILLPLVLACSTPEELFVTDGRAADVLDALRIAEHPDFITSLSMGVKQRADITQGTVLKDVLDWCPLLVRLSMQVETVGDTPAEPNEVDASTLCSEFVEVLRVLNDIQRVSWFPLRKQGGIVVCASDRTISPESMKKPNFNGPKFNNGRRFFMSKGDALHPMQLLLPRKNHNERVLIIGASSGGRTLADQYAELIGKAGVVQAPKPEISPHVPECLISQQELGFKAVCVVGRRADKKCNASGKGPNTEIIGITGDFAEPDDMVRARNQSGAILSGWVPGLVFVMVPTFHGLLEGPRIPLRSRGYERERLANLLPGSKSAGDSTPLRRILVMSVGFFFRTAKPTVIEPLLRFCVVQLASGRIFPDAASSFLTHHS